MPWLGVLGDAVDWFLDPPEGEARSSRTWGLVPLVVASSTRGFGGGLKFVETDLFDMHVQFDVQAKASSNEFFDLDLDLGGPPLPLGPGVKWTLSGGYHSWARYPFFGIGNEASEHDQSSLWLERTYTELRLGHTFLSERVALFSVLLFDNINARPGRENDLLDLDPVNRKYDPEQLTGFKREGYSNAVGLTLLVEDVDSASDPTDGWRLELGGRYHGPETGANPFRFGSYYAELAWFRRLWRERLVLALRGRIDLVDSGLGSVPFYKLPSLGGGDSLRGFLDGRWRDRHAVLFQAELRFPIWRMLAGAVFFDAGRVFDDVTDPPFLNEFHYDGGVGLRLILHPNILTRFDLGVSEELVTFWLSFGHSF